MPPEGWAEECRQAAQAGYTSSKLKARPWFDLHAAIQAVQEVVPPGFHLDLDYNGTLANSANAIPHLRELEAYPEVAMIETPIPQNDVAGNKQIRNLIARPIAMHYNNPPIETTMKEDVTDGFVICAGASRLLKQASVCEQWNKPFWLQLVGSGITTAWAAHLGAVLPQAKWPAITCMNIWEHQLIKPAIEVRGGFYRVPETPGLGVEIDSAAIANNTPQTTHGSIPLATCTRIAAKAVKSPITPAQSRTCTTSIPAIPSPYQNPIHHSMSLKTTAQKHLRNCTANRKSRPCEKKTHEA